MKKTIIIAGCVAIFGLFLYFTQSGPEDISDNTSETMSGKLSNSSISAESQLPQKKINKDGKGGVEQLKKDFAHLAKQAEQSNGKLAHLELDEYKEPVLLSEEEKKRHEELRRLGHLIPVEYYNYPLSVIESMSEAGDSAASYHLGERYYFQLLENPNHHDYNGEMNYQQAARDAFNRALVQGNRHSAAVISELNMIEGRGEEAYAWNLLAEELGDKEPAEWFRTMDIYKDLTDEQRTAARERYQSIRSDLQETWSNSSFPPLL